jgi:glycine reductase complex component B subunit alpha and beta
MRLENHVISISHVEFASPTGITGGVLSVDRNELERLILQDERLNAVDIGLANPGDRCRVARVSDVIEPRARLQGQDFPGALGRHATVGDGRTCVLRGAAVAVSEYWAEPGNRDPVGEFIDTWGPGAETGPYGKLGILSIVPQPSPNVSLAEYRLAMKLAGLKTAVYLASAGSNLPASNTEVYDLPFTPAQNGLPRVAYIFQVLTNQFEPLRGDPVLYGDNIERIVPTILHPNEVFDGALLAPYNSSFMETYSIQNHPIIRELYAHHGKTLHLAGVVITNAPNNPSEFERAATIAANLAKYTLGADAAILTKIGGGAPELTMARTAQHCEELGVKTALAFLHMGIDTTDISPRPATIFNASEIDAMVSMGAPVGGTPLPVPERIIGIPGGLKAGGETTKQLRQVKGAFSQVGSSRLVAVRY